MRWIERSLRRLFPASWREHDAKIAELSRQQIQHETDVIIYEEMVKYLQEQKK